MSSQKPVLVIFGGPNGSGKSSIFKGYSTRIPDYYINADAITMSKIDQMGIQSVSSKRLREINLEAAQEADRLREDAISARRSFATETVMSTNKGIEIMQAAKGRGYHVHLVYVVTYDPEINVKRIQTRVAKGGHPVPQEKIVSRYDRCMELLPQEILIADVAEVYNNSLQKPVLILEKTSDGDIAIYPQKPPSEWNRIKLENLKNTILRLGG